MNDADVLNRLRQRSQPFYDPAMLADQILRCLHQIEDVSDGPPAHRGYRKRTGLLCAPEFRGFTDPSHVENAVTEWIAELCPNAESQVRGLVDGAIPDIVFSFDRDAHGEDILVILEAKAVWQRWITTGENHYPNVATDERGRSTGNYASGNIGDVIRDRDKLLRRYTDHCHRHMLLALVFQRPGELDEQLVRRVGRDWSVRSQHVVDQCNPSDDTIGVTGMVFWPTHESTPPSSVRPRLAPPSSP